MKPPRHDDSTAAPRILLVRLSALGDVIQSLPALAMLRVCYPHAVIGWLVEEEARAFVEGHPLLDYVHVSRRKKWLKALSQPGKWLATLKEIRHFFKNIQAVGYTVGLDLQGLIKSALSLFLTGIPNRIGLAAAREGAPLLYTRKISLPFDYFDPTRPFADSLKSLVAALGCPAPDDLAYPLPPVPETLLQNCEALLSGFSPARPLVVLAPATKWRSKHWLPGHWRRLIEMLLDRTDANLLLVGAPSDQTLAEDIVSGLSEPVRHSERLLNAVGKTSLTLLQAVFERTQLVIGPDSAPLHLAGAVGKSKIIGLYGPTSPKRTSPPNVTGQNVLLAVSPNLACQPCNQSTCPLETMDCMRQLTPENVFEQAKAHLDSGCCQP